MDEETKEYLRTFGNLIAEVVNDQSALMLLLAMRIPLPEAEAGKLREMAASYQSKTASVLRKLAELQ